MRRLESHGFLVVASSCDAVDAPTWSSGRSFELGVCQANTDVGLVAVNPHVLESQVLPGVGHSRSQLPECITLNILNY